jgi:hypothetical protein
VVTKLRARITEVLTIQDQITAPYFGDELASGLEAAATKPLLQPIYRLHIEPLETIFNAYVGSSNGMIAHNTSYFARMSVTLGEQSCFHRHGYGVVAT